MAISFFWRCEGTTLDGTDDLPAGDTSATAEGTPAINATAALVGSNGIEITAPTLTAEGYRLDSNTTLADRLVGSLAFWFRVQTWAAGHSFIEIAGSVFDRNLRVKALGSSGSGNLRFVVNDEAASPANLDLTGNAIALNTTYFCTASWDQPNNDRRVRLYNSSGSLIDSTEDTATAYSAPADLVATDGFLVGDVAATGAFDCYLDNVFVGKAYADADDFLTNRSITSYTQYVAGGAVTGADHGLYRGLARGYARGLG